MGTDLFEERFAHMQNQEFSFRADIVKPIDLLRSATSINAEIMQKVGQLGCVAPGAYADLLVDNGNPLHDIHLMSAPERKFDMTMKGGEGIKHEVVSVGVARSDRRAASAHCGPENADRA